VAVPLVLHTYHNIQLSAYCHQQTEAHHIAATASANKLTIKIAVCDDIEEGLPAWLVFLAFFMVHEVELKPGVLNENQSDGDEEVRIY